VEVTANRLAKKTLAVHLLCGDRVQKAGFKRQVSKGRFQKAGFKVSWFQGFKVSFLKPQNLKL
jgi:hypothetical protein